MLAHLSDISLRSINSYIAPTTICMIKVRLLSLFLFALVVTAKAQETQPIRVTFTLRSADLPDSTLVYITGSHEQLGNWNPAKIKMVSKGNHEWTKEITVARPMNLEYKSRMKVR